MQFFDAHNHVNSQLFGDNWEIVVEEARRTGVVEMLNNGGDVAESRRAVSQAEATEGMWAAIGVHPEALPAGVAVDKAVAELKLLAEGSDKVVALGELGLDYTLDMTVAPKTDQLGLIEPQLALAQELELPVVLHVRDVPGSQSCFNDAIELLKNFSGLIGQFHCWTGTTAQAEKALELGYYISFSGILTYKNASTVVETAAMVPEDRLLVETDAPYLVPEPKRTEMSRAGLRNNDRLCLPEYVTMTAEKLRLIRGQSLEEVAMVTTKNALSLFGIDSKL